MKNEITVGHFLEMLQKSIWKQLPDKSSLYDGYYNRIEGLLHGLDKEICIKDIDSLDGLTKEFAFDSFVRESTVEELDKRFYAIAMEIGTWKVHMVDIIELQGRNAIRKKKGEVGIVIIIVLLVAALACGVILITTSLNDESPLNKIMSAILTATDILLGIIFFLYEFISDRKEKALDKSIETAKEKGKVDWVINNGNVYIKKQINKNKGNVVNGDETVSHYHNESHYHE